MGAWTALLMRQLLVGTQEFGFPWLKLTNGIALSRGVGKKTDVRSRVVDSVFFGWQRGV